MNIKCKNYISEIYIKRVLYKLMKISTFKLLTFKSSLVIGCRVVGYDFMYKSVSLQFMTFEAMKINLSFVTSSSKITTNPFVNFPRNKVFVSMMNGGHAEKLRIGIVSIYVTVVNISACKFTNENVLKGYVL